MGESEGVRALSSLCVGSALVYLEGLLIYYVHGGAQDKFCSLLRDAMQSIPPNFHEEFLDKLAPRFDRATTDKLNQNVLDFIDELALLLLSPSVGQINVDKFRFPTRNPTKYLKALEFAKSLKAFISQKENVWKYSASNFRLLSCALMKMPLLRHLTLRHIRICSYEIHVLLEGLASNAPHLTYLDLKYSAVTDSGLDVSVVEKFGNQHNYEDCVPALLKMKNLRHLNVSESWLTFCGIKDVVEHLPLERLDAIVNDCYDLQAVAIKTLMAHPEASPLPLSRKAYTFASDELLVKDICKACPLLEHVIIQHCYSMNINMYFSALSELKHLTKITLCSLEWTLGPHVPLEDDEPQVISQLVKEITLQDPSQVDAHHLGVLSLCFPEVTHLWILGRQDGLGDEPWSRGRVFTKLNLLHFEGTLAGLEYDRIEREQGLLSILDVLLGWCKNLRCLTLYTDELDDMLLHYAIRRNGLHHLEELRIGLQQNLSDHIIHMLLHGTYYLRILGRTDWWYGMDADSKHSIIEISKMRFKQLEIFGLDDSSDVNEDPKPNRPHQKSYI